MILIPHTTQYVFVMSQIAPRTELGAPADPTNYRVQMAFSPKRSPADDIEFFLGQWQVNTLVRPPQYWAMCAIGQQTLVGPLARGAWWPIVRVVSNPEIPDLIGEPFRVY